MKWLKRKLHKWVSEVSNEVSNSELEIADCSISLSTKSLSSDGFRIQVYRANGGTVLETSVYDRQKDRNQNGLYVVTEDDQLGETIAKIITMESLRS